MLRYIGYVCAALAGIALSVIVVLGVVIYQRMQLDYDDNGLFFDPVTLVTYQEHTILILAIVVGLVALFFTGAFWMGRKMMRLFVEENG